MNTIDQLAAALEAAKITESQATAARIDAENALLAHMPDKPEGDVRVTGAQYRAIATFKVNRSLDAAALSAMWQQMPEGIRNVFPAKHSLDLKEMRHWQNNNPDEYARYIAPVVTAKPGKPSVRVETLVSMREAA